MFDLIWCFEAGLLHHAYLVKTLQAFYLAIAELRSENRDQHIRHLKEVGGYKEEYDYGPMKEKAQVAEEVPQPFQQLHERLERLRELEERIPAELFPQELRVLVERIRMIERFRDFMEAGGV